ncbi:MAG: SocA family protein [Methanobrevibacter sp.]|jgi:uncharacterized phage-associated protein|nr:SocA family protein [Candidatus Methanoflexus mossambicus]
MLYNIEKMKEAIHYIIHQCGEKENVGKTVIYKLLYFSDFDYFELNEKSITNETYQKYPQDPVPIHFEEIKNELITENKITEEITQSYPGYSKYNYSSKTNPELKYLKKDEIERINKVINKLSNKTAREISDYSHNDIPWRATKDYNNIKYEFVFYRNEPYTVGE